MEVLVKITEKNGNSVVRARDLHQFLESKQEFANWIKNRIEKYGLVENEDYVVFDNLIKNPQGGRPQIEYALTIDAAKELSMVEGNDKGKQARRYFIECEKKLREKTQSAFVIPGSFSQALMLAAKQQEQIEEQLKQISVMSTEIVEMKKKTDYLEIILNSKETVTITQIAQDYGMTAKSFNRLLEELKIQRKVNGQWILYSPYITQGYVHSKSVPIMHKDGSRDSVLNTEWRQKGRIFLYEKLKKAGVLPLIERN
jgi:phage anti-repressor protein/phage antirepressor YoqD-like protein